MESQHEPAHSSSTSTRERKRLETSTLATDQSAILVRLIERRAAGTVIDVLWNYDLGSFAHQLRYEASGNRRPKALATVARALDMDPNTLRRIARVAEAIPAGEIAEYVELRNRRGMPLTWSHIEQLTKCRGARMRQQFAHDAISKELSVRGLVAQMGSVASRNKTDDGGPIDMGALEAHCPSVDR